MWWVHAMLLHAHKKHTTSVPCILIVFSQHPHYLAVVDCGDLTDPANGQVTHTSGTTFRQIATYSCNTGYNLVGDSTRTCQATGVWSGSAPTCEGVLLKVLFICVYK